MAATKSVSTILASVSVPAGGTKVAPNAAGVGFTANISTDYEGELLWKLTNGATPPTIAATITIYVSPDNGANWFEYYSIIGDAIANSVNSGAIRIDAANMYVKADVYGNTVQAVTAQILVERLTAI